ncbi:MAG: hypothetical protein ABSE90_02100 [Verrucomicrobiota bacterium]
MRCGGVTRTGVSTLCGRFHLCRGTIDLIGNAGGPAISLTITIVSQWRRDRFAQAGLQQLRDHLATFLPPLIQFPAIDHPEAHKSQEADQRSHAQRANNVNDELLCIVGKIFHQNLSIAKTRRGKRNQDDHQPHRALHAARVALNLYDPFVQFLAPGAFVIKNALPQKHRMFLVFAHHH